MNVDKLRDYVLSYSLHNCPRGNQGYNRILLQLFGYLGHGKSSFVNSCRHVLQDRGQPFTAIARSGEAQGGLTMVRKSYQLTPTITIVDNRGCSTLNSFETGEIYAQLGNFIPLDRKVEWTREFVEMLTRMQDSEVNPNFTDIIVPIFVYSVRRDLTPAEIQEIKTFLINCRNLSGIFPIIVLTHKTSGNFTKFRDLFEEMGAEEIIGVENYRVEDHTETRGRHLQFLNLMYKVLQDVNFKMQKKIDQRKERAEHRTFLLSFLHSSVKPSSSVPKTKSKSKTDALKNYIISYSLNDYPEGNQGYNRILLQLCGYLGHGKSSLINSCVHVLQDRKQPFTVVAQSGEAQGGLTMERKSYPLTPTITIVDNRGCSTLNGFETGELYAQLGNFIPLDMKVEWTQGFEEMLTRLEDSEVEPNFTDIIVPIFVYSVRRDLIPEEVQEIKTFLTNCRNLTGIFPIIVLTHKTSGNLTKFHDLFEGMGAEEIIAVENYTAEDHTETRGRHLQFLNLMQKVLEDVDFKMQKPINLKKERAKHKTFLFSFLHTRK